MFNPYENIVWDTAQQIKSFTHMHAYSQSYFDAAIALGYKHFAISHYDPSSPYYPLADFFENVPQDVIGSPNSEKARTTDDGSHFTALGSMMTGAGAYDAPAYTWKELFTQIINNLQYSSGGGVILNHPTDLDLKKRCEMLDFDDRVLGIEIYNNIYEHTIGANYYQNLVNFWDKILSTGRKCYGFCVVDWQVEDYLPHYGSSVLLVPAFTEQACLEAYRNGEFYGMIKDTGFRFTSIVANETSVSVSLNRAGVIKFFTEKGLESTVSGTSATYSVSNKVFVRVEAIESGDADSHLFSNAIMYKSYSDLQKRKKTIRNIVIFGG